MLTWRCFVSCLCKRVSDMLPCSLAAEVSKSMVKVGIISTMQQVQIRTVLHKKHIESAFDPVYS